MVRVAVSGYELDVRDELIQSMGAPHDEIPRIGRCWSVTTPDYRPLLLAELEGGLLIMSAPAVGEESQFEALGLRWNEIESVRQDEHAWKLLIVAVDGRHLGFLLSSVAELHSVAAELSGRCAESRASIALEEGVPVDSSALGDPHMVACGRLPRPLPHARSRSRVRVHQQPSPTLDRIEQRLASMEQLLAGLKSGSRHEDR